MAQRSRRTLLGGLVSVAVAAAAGPAALAQDAPVREPVDLELVLAVDISGSMDRGEQQIQREGYVEAFRDPNVVGALLGGYHGRVAVTYMEWGNEFSQFDTVPWTLIDSEEDAEAFAAAMEASPLFTVRGTSLSGALEGAARRINSNDYEGIRRVIDVSGDGSNRDGPPLEPVRAAVEASGIVVNGLPLMLRPGVGGPGGWGYERVDLEVYFRENVIAGSGAFVIPVRGLDALKDSIRQKLILEIAGLTPPEPVEQAALDSGWP
jgi:hypothetical protein